MFAQLRETQRRLEQSVPYSAVVKSHENDRLRLMLDAAKAAGSAKHVDQLLGAALDTVERLTHQARTQTADAESGHYAVLRFLVSHVRDAGVSARGRPPCLFLVLAGG